MSDDDMVALRRVDEWAFAMTSTDSRWDTAAATLERDRQLGAFVDGALAGHTAAFTVDLTVPGGVVPCAGVTWVAVFPANRRRGVLRTLMTRQLAELGESGEPVAALWASEPGIYGRYGYGPASRLASVAVERGVELAGPAAAGVTVRLADLAESLEPCQAVYERLRPTHPGMVSRGPAHWAESSFDDPTTREGWSARRCAVAVDDDGTPLGYAWFRTKPSWRHGSPAGTTEVAEFLAVTAGATRALLDVVLDLDLMATTEVWNLPVDHPLLTLTAGTARVRPVISDQLWVRLVRLAEALTARRYAAEVDVVLEVSDETCPWNEGRWRLSADPSGSTVARTTDPADVALDVARLAGAYLGDDHLERALVAGLVDERTAGRATVLARAMRGDRAPYCPYVF